MRESSRVFRTTMAVSSPTSSSESLPLPSSNFASLPIMAMKRRIIEKILENRVTLIVGEPGCGTCVCVVLFLLFHFSTLFLRSETSYLHFRWDFVVFCISVVFLFFFVLSRRFECSYECILHLIRFYLTYRRKREIVKLGPYLAFLPLWFTCNR